MIGDASEHAVQIGFGIETVELCGFDERVGRGGALTTGIGAGEHIILPTQGQRSDGALGGVVADLQVSIVEKTRERGPARARIADRSGQFAMRARAGPRSRVFSTMDT